MKKKGQITIFIIIGLVILLLIGVLTYYMTREKVTTELPRITIPEEAKEISDLLTVCVKSKTVEGLKKIGLSGGFIDQRVLRSNFFNPTEEKANSLEFLPNNKVAYWSYMSAKNTCAKTGSCKFAKIPPITLDKIKEDLENYVLQKFNDCKEKLKSLEEWQIEELGKEELEILFTDEEVGVHLKYPIRVSKGSTSTDLTELMIPIRLRFKEIYKNAEILATTAQQTGFLGEFVMQLIRRNAGLEKGEFPPIREVTNELGPGKFWIKINVKKQLEDLLSSEVQLLQVENSANYEVYQPEPGEDANAYYLSFTKFYNLPIKNINPDLAFEFFYSNDWNIYLDMDCPGGICKAESVLFKNIIPFGIQHYSTVYDVSYPVLVSIKDNYALGGEGYTFNIALEGNIRNNQVLTAETTSKDYSFKESIANDMCDQTKRTSGLITFNIFDKSTNERVDDAVISFSHIEDCIMGTSKNGVFKSKFPRGLGGVVSIFKQGYLEEFIPLDTEEEDQTINVFLEPFKKLKVKIVHYPIKKKDSVWNLEKTVELPDKDEDIYVILARDDFVRAVNLNYDNKFTGELELAPGKYNVTIQSILSPDPPLIIPSREKKIRLYPGKTKKVKIPEKDLVFDKEEKLISGKASFEWNLKSNELYDNNEVKFYYFYHDLKGVGEGERTIEDLTVLSSIENYNQEYKNLLLPELK